MADERVRTALRREAADAPAAAGLWERTEQRLRRRRQRRWASAVAAVAVALVSAGVAVDAVTSDPAVDVALDDADAPGQGEPDAVGEGGVDVDAGPVRVTVDERWHVVDVDDHVVTEDHPVAAVDQDAFCPLPDDRPVLIVWQDAPAPPCPEDPPPAGLSVRADETALADVVRESLGGDAVEQPAARDDAAATAGAATSLRWSAHQRATVGSMATVAFDEPLQLHPDAAGEGRTVLAPALGVIAVTHTHEHREAVNDALTTLRPIDDAADGVVLGDRWPQGRPLPDVDAAGSEPLPGHVWALDADARLHEWYETEAVEGAEDQFVPSPGARADAFAAVLRADGQARVIAGRPDVDGREVFAYPDPELVPKADTWSPDGDAIVWIDRDAATAHLVAWDDLDALVDGDDPAVEQTVAVEGATHPDGRFDTPGPGSLAWPNDDVLVDDGWGLRATLQRDDHGRPHLPDPLRFRPAE